MALKSFTEWFESRNFKFGPTVKFCLTSDWSQKTVAIFLIVWWVQKWLSDIISESLCFSYLFVHIKVLESICFCAEWNAWHENGSNNYIVCYPTACVVGIFNFNVTSKLRTKRLNHPRHGNHNIKWAFQRQLVKIENYSCDHQTMGEYSKSYGNHLKSYGNRNHTDKPFEFRGAVIKFEP